jgi:PPM family protein phosphatase
VVYRVTLQAIESLRNSFLMLKFDTYARSDIGRVRTNNEDSFGAAEPRDRQPMSQSGWIYVVADGMGGHEEGERASAFAVETLLKEYYRQPTLAPEKRLREIFAEINQSLIDYTKEKLQPGERTGTTLVAAVLRGDKLWVASVGDSRLYLIREGGIRQVTRDHTVIAELVRAGSVRKEDAAESKYRNRLSRSIGSESRVEVDVFPSIPLHPGDILLLCTDGLSQYATSDALLRAAHGTAQEIADRLIEFANDCGGSDNITVSVIRVEGHPRLHTGFSASQVAWIVLGVVILLSLLLLAAIGIFLRLDNRSSSTPTVAVTQPGLLLPTDFMHTPSSSWITQTALIPATPLTETPAATGSPTSSLVDCEFTVAAGNTTATIAERFGARLNQVYRRDGTQQDMNIIRLGEVLVLKGISPEACTNGGGVIPITPTITP